MQRASAQVETVGRRITGASVALWLAFVAVTFGVLFWYVRLPVYQGPTYITAPILLGSITTAIKATGTVDAVVSVEVSSQLSGRIANVFVNFNDEVKAGQPIARIDPETYVARVNEANAALKIARAQVELQQAALERAKASLESARTARVTADAQLIGLHAKFQETDKELQRKTGLSKIGIATEVELTRVRAQHVMDDAAIIVAQSQRDMKVNEIAVAEADLRMAVANIRNAEAVVEQREASLEQTQLDLQRTEIRAPIDGVIIKRDVNPGQTVAVSLQATTLFTIANDLRKMEVHGKIDEADVGRLKVGQAVNFTVDAYPDHEFTGQVLQIRRSPEVVQNVVTYTAVITAANTDQLLFPGMTANLRITISEIEDVLKIPKQALAFRPKNESSDKYGSQALDRIRQAAVVTRSSDASGSDVSSNGSATVWMLGEHGKPLPVRVTIGQSDAGGAQLLSGGLISGQRVVIGVASSATHWGF